MGRPCEPVRDLIGDDPALAYAVQRAGIDRRTRAGAVAVGRKVGLTSETVQQQLGVDQPDFGTLLDIMHVADGGEAPHDRLLQPRAEAEIAFVLGADLPDPGDDLDAVRAAIGYATAAIEIVDSRIARWDITFADTVADNGSSGLFVLGQERLDLSTFEPLAVTMSMRRIDGDGSTVVSTGTGSACLGDPLKAMAWLASTLDRSRPAAPRRRSGPVGCPRSHGRRRARRDVRRPPRAQRFPIVIGLGHVLQARTSDPTRGALMKTKVAVIGSGNIGTDLMIKILRLSDTLEIGALVGIDPASEGLARAARLGVPTTADGVEGLVAMDGFDDIEVVFDATSAKAHQGNAARLAPTGQAAGRPDTGSDRPVRGAGRQPRRAHGCTETSTWSPVAARPPSPWSRRSPAWSPRRTPRSSPPSPPSRPAPAPGPTSTSSPRPPHTRSRSSAERAAARR